jgi:hypothetical protein
MTYEGETLNYFPANLDFALGEAVIVSCAGPNLWGHALLFVPFRVLLVNGHNYR